MLLPRSNNLKYNELGLITQTHIQVTAIFTHHAHWFVYAMYFRIFIIDKIMKVASGTGIGSVMLNVR